PGKPLVALVSASLARALFPAGDAVGQHIRLAGPQGSAPCSAGLQACPQDIARSQFPMAYVRASGDLATVRDGYTRVIKALGHRALRPFMTSSEWVDS